MTCAVRFIKIALPIIFGLVIGDDTKAERRDYLLKQNMLQQEVLQRLGAPHEKSEFESKREEIWRYGDLEVYFRSGLVTRWRQKSTDSLEVLTAQNVSAGANGEIDKDSSVMMEILGEIMKSDTVVEPTAKSSIGSLSSMSAAPFRKK